MSLMREVTVAADTKAPPDSSSPTRPTIRPRCPTTSRRRRFDASRRGGRPARPRRFRSAGRERSRRRGRSARASRWRRSERFSPPAPSPLSNPCAGERFGHGLRRGLRRIDQRHGLADGLSDDIGEHREMRAAEHQRIRRRRAPEQRPEIMLCRRMRGGRCRPAFLGQRHEHLAGLLHDLGVAHQLADGARIGAAFDRALGRDHGDAAIARGGDAGPRAGLDHADHRHLLPGLLQQIERDRLRPCCRRSPASSRPGRAAAASPAARRPAPSRRSWCRRGAARYRRDRRSAHAAAAPPARAAPSARPCRSRTPRSAGGHPASAPPKVTK